MNLTILYFASLRESLGMAKEAVVLPADVGNVGALRAHLSARGETWQRLASGHNVRAAVNQHMAADEQVLAEGDEVAFFPPVTGG
ncbi:MAG: molybdopterin converting factor subunit 1 [Denitromonas halophila]|nr:MAG: molybdopterin converting factor subunit 1 [Denitromonas halophila]